MSTSSSYENDLLEFLQERLEPIEALKRIECPDCGAPSKLYCPDCCRVVIPSNSWPEIIARGDFRLPYDLDLVLDDRRNVATGIQAAAVLNSSLANERTGYRIFVHDENDSRRLQELASYGDKGVAVLFPSTNSRSISSFLEEENGGIDRLVVLDCKWTKSKVSIHPLLDSLPKVHLDVVPTSSYYWRWHNAGQGKVSTIEAIYYAARSIAVSKNWTDVRKKELVNLFWLFRLQRHEIRRQYEAGEVWTSEYKGLPFSEDAKQSQRKLRQGKPSKS